MNEKQLHQTKTHFVKSKNGQLITDENEMLDRWVEYFNELLNSLIPMEGQRLDRKNNK